MVKADDMISKSPGFDSQRRNILYECHEYAPNVTRLTLNTLQSLMVGH